MSRKFSNSAFHEFRLRIDFLGDAQLLDHAAEMNAARMSCIRNRVSDRLGRQQSVLERGDGADIGFGRTFTHCRADTRSRQNDVATAVDLSILD